MISALSRPRRHCGTITGSVRTFSRPSAVRVVTVQAMARSQVLGTAEAGTVGVGQLREAPIGEVVGLSGAHQTERIGPIAIQPGV